MTGPGRPLEREAERVRAALPVVMGANPLLPAALAATRDPVHARVLVAGLRALDAALREAGRSALEVDRAWLETWLETSSCPNRRARRVEALRRVYRHAVALGLRSDDPTVGMHWNSPNVRCERRLTQDEARRVVLACRQPTTRTFSRIVACRDLVLVGLGLWLACDAEQVRELRWGDVGLGNEATFRLPGDDNRRAMPTSVAGLFVEYRSALGEAGIEITNEDAVLASYHPSLQYSWLAADRDLLRPLTRSGILKAVHQRCLAAGLVSRAVRRPGRRKKFAAWTYLQWLGRPNLAAVDAALADDAATRRIPMRHSRAA